MEETGFDLVLAGGLFRSANSLMLDTLYQTVRAVAPGARPVRLDMPPVVGGVLLAMDAVGWTVTPEVRMRLEEGARRHLAEAQTG